VFDPRDTTLSDVERQAQLDAVVAGGDGTEARNGMNAETDVVFENLFDWTLNPKGAVFDAYSPTQCRAENVRLGSCVIAGGTHAMKFTVVGKQPASTGYKIGLDCLTASPSYSIREAEALLPSLNQSGGIADYQYMEGGSWGGNYQVLFPATAQGHYFTLNLESDLWQERNFQTSGDSHDNTTVDFDTSTDPGEFVVELEGLGTNWSAQAQTGATNSLVTSSALPAAAVMRVLVRGEEMVSGNWINWDGARCRVCWRGGPGSNLTLTGAYLGEAASSDSNTMDVASGTQHALTFGGSASGEIPANGALWSDYADVSIEQEKSYLISYRLAPVPAGGRLHYWTETITPGLASTFLIPAMVNPTDADSAAETWSGRGDVISTNAVIGVEFITTSFAAAGTYVSTVFDTHCASPAYTELNWDAVVPAGCSIQVKVRTGGVADMSDAPAWEDISFIPNFGMIDPGNKQFVQFLTQLGSSVDRLQTPKLKEFTIKWQGQEQIVAIGGTFTKGPDYGTFEVTVDGQEILTGLMVDLSIFKDARGHGDTRRLTSSLAVEVNPRNTGM